MPAIPSTATIANSGVFFSYIETDITVYLDMFTEANLAANSAPTRAPDTGISHDILKETVVKRTNYNPNNSTDRYGVNTKAKRYLKFAHTFNDREYIDNEYTGGAPVDNATFNIYLNEAFGSIIINTYQWYQERGTDEYTVGPKQSIFYNDINNEAWGRISLAVNHQCLPIGSGYLYSILNANYHDIDTADLCVYDNHDIDMGHNGTISVVDDVQEKTITLTTTSTNNLNTLNSLGIARVEAELYDDGVSHLITTKKDMAYTYYPATYDVSFPWNDQKYSDITGASISENWTLDAHMHTMLVSKYTGLPYNILSLAADATFTHPTVTGYFYYSDADTMLSGYYSIPSMYIKTPDNAALNKMQLHYNDNNSNEQIIDVKNLQHVNFDISHTYLLGKSCQIRSYYNTIADDFYNASSSVVPIHNCYFDIEDITLTMSGVRTDPSLGNTEYTSNFLTETDGIVYSNKLHKKFRSVGEVKIIANFTVKSNSIDFNDVSRLINPYPRDMWLVAVPIEGLVNATLNSTFLKIKEDVIIANRNTPTELSKFPKISSSAAKSMSELCTGSPHTATTEGIIWNKLTPGNPEIPEDGTFSEDTYTIDVTVSQGSWAPFIIISDMGPDGYRNFTGYCISNVNNYETPHLSSFKY